MLLALKLIPLPLRRQWRRSQRSHSLIPSHQVIASWAKYPFPWGGRRSEARKEFVYLKMGLKPPAPLINFIFHFHFFHFFSFFHFLPDEKFSDVGGGGRPGLARAPNNPPPPSLPGSLSSGLHPIPPPPLCRCTPVI